MGSVALALSGCSGPPPAPKSQIVAAAPPRDDGGAAKGGTGGSEHAAALEQSLSISSTAELRDASLRIFDRTFAITDVLRLLCVLVAALGAWSAFGALQLDRLREVAVLRALGATPRQVFVTTCSQSALLGLCAGLLAIPTGTVLAVLLTEVVNRRSFGWTLLALEVPLATMAGALLLSVGAATLAGLLPAWQLSRRPFQEALRDE